VAQADAKIHSLDVHGIRVSLELPVVLPVPVAHRNGASLIQDHDAQAKVKIVADMVWANLTGVFSKDAQHVQVMNPLAQLCLPPALQAISEQCSLHDQAITSHLGFISERTTPIPMNLVHGPLCLVCCP
jgi:hypothetical protein